MNKVLRYSLSAVFTSLATSYFLGTGIPRLIHTPRPTVPAALGASVGTGLASVIGVREDLFRPLGAPPDPNEGMWRAIKGEQSSLKVQVDNIMATLLRVEQEWRGSDRKVDDFGVKVAEAQRMAQESKNALEAAQIRIAKLEGVLKTAQDKEQKATMEAKRMVKMFATMTPEKAEKILEEWSTSDTVDLLARMKESQSAAILALFPPKRAAVISARLSGNRGGTP